MLYECPKCGGKTFDVIARVTLSVDGEEGRVIEQYAEPEYDGDSWATCEDPVCGHADQLQNLGGDVTTAERQKLNPFGEDGFCRVCQGFYAHRGGCSVAAKEVQGSTAGTA